MEVAKIGGFDTVVRCRRRGSDEPYSCNLGVCSLVERYAGNPDLAVLSFALAKAQFILHRSCWNRLIGIDTRDFTEKVSYLFKNQWRRITSDRVEVNGDLFCGAKYFTSRCSGYNGWGQVLWEDILRHTFDVVVTIQIKPFEAGPNLSHTALVIDDVVEANSLADAITLIITVTYHANYRYDIKRQLESIEEKICNDHGQAIDYVGSDNICHSVISNRPLGWFK